MDELSEQLMLSEEQLARREVEVEVGMAGGGGSGGGGEKSRGNSNEDEGGTGTGGEASGAATHQQLRKQQEKWERKERQLLGDLEVGQDKR